MLRISTKGRYGLRFMLELALNYGNGAMLLRDVAASQEISEKYLGHLVMPLKSAGLIYSSRGAHGGYMLARPPSAIRVREIVEALEGPLVLAECVKAPGICNRADACVTRTVWAKAGQCLIDLFDAITLAEMMNLDVKRDNKDKEGSI